MSRPDAVAAAVKVYLVQGEDAGRVVDAANQRKVVLVAPVAAHEIAPDHEPGPGGLLLKDGNLTRKLADFPHRNGLSAAQGHQLVVMGLFVVPGVDIGRQYVHVLVAGIEDTPRGGC